MAAVNLEPPLAESPWRSPMAAYFRHLYQPVISMVRRSAFVGGYSRVRRVTTPRLHQSEEQSAAWRPFLLSQSPSAAPSGRSVWVRSCAATDREKFKRQPSGCVFRLRSDFFNRTCVVSVASPSMFQDAEETLVANVVALRKQLRRTESSLQSLGEQLRKVKPNSSLIHSWPTAWTGEIILEKGGLGCSINPPGKGKVKNVSFVSVGVCNGSLALQSFSGPPSSAQLVEMENAQLRSKLSTIREENSCLLVENRQLASKLEGLQCELTNSRTKIRLLESTVGSRASVIPVLKEQIHGLDAEVKAQENALRDAQLRLEQSQQSKLFSERAAEALKEELRKVKTELAERTRQWKRTERQRNEALLNAEKLTVAFQEHKVNVSVKLKKAAEAEQRLKVGLEQRDAAQEALRSRCAELEHEGSEMRRQIRQLSEEHGKSQVMQSLLAAEKADLQSLLEESRQQILKLEGELAGRETILRERESLKRENGDLRALSDCQSQRLAQCQREMEESQAELTSLESILAQLQAELGGVAPKDCGGERKAVSQDLRLQLSRKDPGPPESQGPSSAVQSELARATQGLQSWQCFYTCMVCSPVSAFSVIRQEVVTQEWDRKYQQLLPMLQALERDRSRQAALASRLRERLAQAQDETSSLRSSMDQRAVHFQHIQDELLGKAAEATRLEKELKRKSSRLAALQRQIEEKTSAYSAAAVRNTELEQELLEKNSSLQRLQNTLNRKQKDFQVTLEKAKNLHVEQCKELESQIELSRCDLEQQQAQMKELERRVSSAQQDRRSAQQRADSLQTALAQLQQEMEVNETRNKETLRTLREQAAGSSTQVKFLESALSTCKEELAFCLRRVEESKEQYEKQLEMKSKEVEDLQAEVRRSTLTVQEAAHSNLQLQHSLHQQQDMLQQSTARIAELEDSQAQLQRQVSVLEQELERQKASAAQELKEREEKLQEACEEGGDRARQAAELSSTVRRLTMELAECRAELTETEKELLRLRRDSSTKASQLSQLELTLQETQGQLEKKSDLVMDLEEKLHRSEADRRNSLQRTQLLESQLQSVRGELTDTLSHLQELRDVLQKTQLSAEEKEAFIDKLAGELRECKKELDDRNNELLDMDSALKDRQWELQQRASQLSQLEVTVREHKSEMEQKISRLEGALEKSQQETKEREKQASGSPPVHFLSERLELAKTQLQEKEDSEKEALAQGQQVRLCRERLQRAVQELQESQEQTDRLARDLAHSAQLAHEKEARANRLAKELGAAQARAAQAEERLQARVKAQQEEMEDIKQAHWAELSALRESREQLLETTGSISSTLKSSQDRLGGRLQQMGAELAEAQGNIAGLQAELAARDQEAQAAREALLIKDAEIARLQARISSQERAMELQNISLCSALPPAGSASRERDSVFHFLHTLPAYRDPCRSISVPDSPRWADADSLGFRGDRLESAQLAGALAGPHDQAWQGPGETSASSESSFNPLTYVVNDDSALSASCAEPEKPDLDTLCGMLQLVNQQIALSVASAGQAAGTGPELHPASARPVSQVSSSVDCRFPFPGLRSVMPHVPLTKQRCSIFSAIVRYWPRNFLIPSCGSGNPSMFSTFL
ncbi:CCD18 protein, partial [Atractosteus spatula]|nr:CCD18 protein [Atractosteus spatula]